MNMIEPTNPARIHLATMGNQWADAKAWERDAARITYRAMQDAHAAGMSEVQIALVAKVDRMTVRRALGKL
jgi:hypothetical protein